MTRSEPGAHEPSSPRRTAAVVIPVYKNEASLDELVERLEALELPDSVELRAVFVIDGSPDASESVLRARLARSPIESTLVVLSRNFGSFSAIRAGIEVADTDYVAVMAADLQEPPELLIEFIAQLETGEVDLVLGRREGRGGDPLLARASSALFWRMHRRFVQPDMPKGGVDVFACNRVVRDAILTLEESNTSLVGLLLWIGFRTASVGYERLPRADEGKSSWTFRKKVRYLSDSLFSFTDLPIHLLLFTGLFGCVAVTITAIAVIVAWIAGVIDVAGYTPIMLSILFVGGLLTFGLGIVGSYVWRAYENTKQRPLAIRQSVDHYGDGPDV